MVRWYWILMLWLQCPFKITRHKTTCNQCSFVSNSGEMLPPRVLVVFSMQSQYTESTVPYLAFCLNYLDFVNISSANLKLNIDVINTNEFETKLHYVLSSLGLSPHPPSSWTQSAPDFLVKRVHASSTCQQLKPKLSSAISARRSPQERAAHFGLDGF